MFPLGIMSFVWVGVKNIIGAIYTKHRPYILGAGVILLLGSVIGLISFAPTAASFFGYETKASIKEQLEVAKRDLTDAIRVAKEQNEELLRNKKAASLLEKTILDKQARDANIETITDEITTIKDRTISDAMNDRTQTVVNVGVTVSKYNKTQIEKIAKANIDALWNLYDKVAMVN